MPWNLSLPDRLKVLVACWLALLFFPPSLSATSQGDIQGLWVMPDGSALVEVYASNTDNGEEQISVRIAALREPHFTVVDSDRLDDDAKLGDARRDYLNPDRRLRQRPLVGLTIVSGLRYRDGRWQGGTIYDPGSGKSYRCRLELEEGGFLRVRGYMGMALLGRTLYWQRAEDFQRRVVSMLQKLDHNVQ